MGTGSLGDKISGAPRGVAGLRMGVAKPGIPGDNSRCVSAAAAVSLRHSSSQAETVSTMKVTFYDKEIQITSTY